MTSPIPLPAPCSGFAVEHLADTSAHRKLIRTFSVGKNAKGLEIYLKESALDEEKSNSSRTYLVTDTGTKELESFVYERVKQDYDKGCIFLYQAL